MGLVGRGLVGLGGGWGRAAAVGWLGGPAGEGRRADVQARPGPSMPRVHPRRCGGLRSSGSCRSRQGRGPVAGPRVRGWGPVMDARPDMLPHAHAPRVNRWQAPDRGPAGAAQPPRAPVRTWCHSWVSTMLLSMRAFCLSRSRHTWRTGVRTEGRGRGLRRPVVGTAARARGRAWVSCGRARPRGCKAPSGAPGGRRNPEGCSDGGLKWGAHTVPGRA
jgi:hypothetical protein